MAFYDLLLNSLRDVKGKIKNDPLTSDNVSGATAGELTIISVTLLAALLLSHISLLISAVIVLILAVVLITNLPLIPKVIKEENNSLDTMMFYVILTMGIVICLIYWGVKYV
jgi:energy-converting hydrogenase B subunit G